MVDVQTLTTMFGGIGVGVAAIYYVMMLRNNEKLRRRDLVFQRLQPATREFTAALYSTFKMQWKTIEEFRRKYNYWSNPDAMTDIYYVLNHFNALGILYKDGIADAEQIFQLYNSYTLIGFYEKFKHIILVSRMTPTGELHNPDMYKPYELLYLEAKRRFPKSSKIPGSEEELIEHGKLFDGHLGITSL
jgi:hypothetical protein